MWKNSFLVVLTFKLIAYTQYTEKFSTYIFNTSLAVSNYNWNTFLTTSLPLFYIETYEKKR